MPTDVVTYVKMDFKNVNLKLCLGVSLQMCKFNSTVLTLVTIKMAFRYLTDRESLTSIQETRAR